MKLDCFGSSQSGGGSHRITLLYVCSEPLRREKRGGISESSQLQRVWGARVCGGEPEDHPTSPSGGSFAVSFLVAQERLAAAGGSRASSLAGNEREGYIKGGIRIVSSHLQLIVLQQNNVVDASALVC